MNAFGSGTYIPAEDRPEGLTAEETEWEDTARDLMRNPIVSAFVKHSIAVEDGLEDPESGLKTDKDVILRWIDYLADGDQEVSWYPPILEQANAFFEYVAKNHNLPYRPGMTHAV